MMGKLVLLRLSLAGNMEKSPIGGSEAMDSVRKSNTENGTVYRIIGGFLYAATSSLNRVTERIFTISECFHRSKPKLNLLISPEQGSKKCKNCRRIYRKY